MDDLHISGAIHWETGIRTNLAIRDGVVRIISDNPISGPSREHRDVSGFLISPPFVEPHYHLDKVLITDGSRPNATFEEQVDAVATSKRNYTVEAVAGRAEMVARMMAMRGICCVRSFADVDSHAGLTALRGLLQLRERLRHVLDIQIVAFPQHGLLADPPALDLMREALALGADLIGGHPQLENSQDEGLRQIETLFGLAAEFNVDLDFHVDENDRPESRWLDAVVDATLSHGWQDRVCVSHCASLASRPREERQHVYSRLKAAGITVVSSPTSGLLFRGHGEVNPARGIVPVRELLAHGVPVACAQEVYRSIFAPNLRFPDPLFTAQIMAYSAKLSDDEGLVAVWRMITSMPAAAMRRPYGLEVGRSADFVLFRAASLADVLGRLVCDRLVFRNGRLLAHSSYDEQLLA